MESHYWRIGFGNRYRQIHVKMDIHGTVCEAIMHACEVPDVGGIVVHRKLGILHVQTMNCWCEPRRFSTEQVEAMTEQELLDELNHWDVRH